MEQNDKELKPASDERDRNDIKANSIQLKGILKVQGEPPPKVYPKYETYERVRLSREERHQYRTKILKKQRRKARRLSAKLMTDGKTFEKQSTILIGENQLLELDKEQPVTAIVRAAIKEINQMLFNDKNTNIRAGGDGGVCSPIRSSMQKDQPSVEEESAGEITVGSVMRDAVNGELENAHDSLGEDLQEQIMGEELQRAVEEREFIMQLSQPSPESEPSGQALGSVGGPETSMELAARRRFNDRTSKACYSCNASPTAPGAIVDSGAAASVAPTSIRMQHVVQGNGVFSSFTGQSTVAEAKGTISMWLKSSHGKYVRFSVDECHRLKDAKHFLLSVSSLCDQLGAKFSFEETGGTMTLPINGGIENIPLVRYRNLYYLQWIDGDMSEPDESLQRGVNMVDDSYDFEMNLVNNIMDEMVVAANTRGPAVMIFEDMYELHCTFGHISQRTLYEMIKRGLLKVKFRSNRTGKHCEACALAKMHRQPVPKKSVQHDYPPGYLWYTDLKGQLDPDLFGNRFWIHFVDASSRLTIVYPIKKKSDVPAVFKKFLDRLRAEGFRNEMKFIQSDNGGEFTSNEMVEILTDEGLLHRKTAPETAAQNGSAERANLWLIEGTRASLNGANLPWTWWSRSVMHQAYVKNRTYHTSLTVKQPGSGGKTMRVMRTPYEVFYGVPPDLSMVRKFGSTVYFWVPGSSNQNPGKKGIFIGVTQDSKSYLVAEWDNWKKVHNTYHVYFPKDNERVMRLPSAGADEEGDRVEDSPADSDEVIPNPTSTTPDEGKPPLDEPTADDLSHESGGERRRSKRSKAKSVEERTRGGVEERTGPSAADTQPRGSESARTPALSPRTVPIGRKQPLTEGDLEWLKYAHKHDIRMKVMQKNPKKGISRSRYESYKKSKTIKQFMLNGGNMGDLKWDVIHGFITFDDVHSLNFMGREDMERECEELKQSFIHFCEQNPLMKEKPDLIQLVNVTLSEFLTKDPKTTREAYNAPDADQWKKAMFEEFESFLKLQVLERLSPEEAKNKKWKKIRTKWVYKKKINKKTGEIERYKARLCAKGFTQREGIDYDEVFAPVFSYSTLRLVLALAAQWDLRVDSFDLQNAFLQQDLDKDHIVIECPEGLDLPLNPDGSKPVFRLLKSLYGLKQSARLLSKRLSAHFIKQGFTQLLSDTCCFVRGEGKDKQIVLVWVDDILFFSARDDEKSREEFKEKLSAEFVLSPHTSGETEVALGINVNRDWENGEITINMPKMIENIALKFGCTDKPAKTPMSSDMKLAKGPTEDVIPASEFDYMSCVGALLYLALTVRPDIAYAVGQLSRFMSCPSADCVKTAKQCMNYLYATRDLGITFKKSVSGKWRDIDDSGNFKNELETYVDADYANSKDTAKSVTGFVMRFNGAAIDWQSKLQSLVAQSTSEAETYAACEVVKRTSYMRVLLHELGVKQMFPTVVHEDNDAVMSFVENYDHVRQTKHFLVKVRYLQQQEQLGIFKFKRVDSEKNIADTFTKPLGKVLFARFRSGLAMVDLAASTGTAEPTASEELRDS